ncbi:MAG: thioredoxin family protein [Nanoarchaeota archaeon]|nr:thioredoxin family protein [Nanoarchaeota archaeon]
MKTFKLFTTQSCPKCPEIKDFVKSLDIEVKFVDAGTPEGLDEARKYNVTGVPTFIIFDDEKEVGRANSVENIKRFI